MATAPEPLTALIALNRFGLGARPGDFAAVASDPRGFLAEELKKPDLALLPGDLPDTRTALQQTFEDQARRKAERAKTASASSGESMVQDRNMAPPADMNDMDDAAPPGKPGDEQMDGAKGKRKRAGKGPNAPRRLYRDEVLARVQKLAQA
ncbi:MAG TPA: hypothetical protein VH858_20030, partial [Hyphomicrobiales bacterium]